MKHMTEFSTLLNLLFRPTMTRQAFFSSFFKVNHTAKAFVKLVCKRRLYAKGREGGNAVSLTSSHYLEEHSCHQT